LKKLGKSRQNHGLQFITRYALKKSLFYCISVTIIIIVTPLHLGSRLKELKYYQTKKYSESRALIVV